LDTNPINYINAYMSSAPKYSVLDRMARYGSDAQLTMFMAHEKTNLGLPLNQDHPALYILDFLLMRKRYGHAGGMVQCAVTHGAIFSKENIQLLIRRRQHDLLLSILGTSVNRIKIAEREGPRWLPNGNWGGRVLSLVEIVSSGEQQQVKYLIPYIIAKTNPNAHILHRARAAARVGWPVAVDAWSGPRRLMLRGAQQIVRDAQGVVQAKKRKRTSLDANLASFWLSQERGLGRGARRAFILWRATWQRVLCSISRLHKAKTCAQTLWTRWNIIKDKRAFAPGGPGASLAAAEFKEAAAGHPLESNVGEAPAERVYPVIYKPTHTAKGWVLVSLSDIH